MAIEDLTAQLDRGNTNLAALTTAIQNAATPTPVDLTDVTNKASALADGIATATAAVTAKFPPAG